MKTTLEWFVEGGRYLLVQPRSGHRYRLVECLGVTSRGLPGRLRFADEEKSRKFADIRGTAWFKVPATDNDRCHELMLAGRGADSFASPADARDAIRPTLTTTGKDGTS